MVVEHKPRLLDDDDMMMIRREDEAKRATTKLFLVPPDRRVAHRFFFPLSEKKVGPESKISCATRRDRDYVIQARFPSG